METQPDLYGGPEVPAELTPPMRATEPPPPPAPSVRALMLRACTATGLSMWQLTGPRLNAPVSRVRKAIYLVAWEARESSIVAKAMNRDPSTVRQMAKAAREMVKTDVEFARLVQRIRG